MGTSASSSGPGSNISFDPPWLNDIPVGGGGEGSDGDGNAAGAPSSAPAPAPIPGVAPAKRFNAARQGLNAFARSGDTDALRRAGGHYSRTGMGGAKAVASRMRTSTKAAAGLGSFLQAARTGADPAVNAWVDALRATNPTAQTVIDAIVGQILPQGGSLDEEAAKDAMALALSELTTLDPGVGVIVPFVQIGAFPQHALGGRGLHPG